VKKEVQNSIMKSKYKLEFNYEFIPAIMSCQFQLHFTASLVLTLNISFTTTLNHHTPTVDDRNYRELFIYTSSPRFCQNHTEIIPALMLQTSQWQLVKFILDLLELDQRAKFKLQFEISYISLSLAIILIELLFYVK